MTPTLKCDAGTAPVELRQDGGDYLERLPDVGGIEDRLHERRAYAVRFGEQHLALVREVSEERAGRDFAWTTHFMLMAWTSAVLEVVQPLGVLKYGALLCRVGWERATSSGRSFDGTRSSLPDLERRTRMSEFAHVVLGALGTGMVVVALACHAWDAAAWLFAANVVLHAYPIMLQRVLRTRLHRLLQSATWRCVVRR